VALAPEGMPLTLKAFAVWTAVLTLILGFWLSAFVGLFGRLGPMGFTFYFVPTVIVVLASSWTGRVDRLLPAALATLIVGIWPAYRWFAGGDWATAKAYRLPQDSSMSWCCWSSACTSPSVEGGWRSRRPGAGSFSSARSWCMAFRP